MGSHEQVPNRKVINETPFLPFENENEQDPRIVELAQEYKVETKDVDKRADGNYYVKGKCILPKGTFDGLTEDRDANPFKTGGTIN